MLFILVKVLKFVNDSCTKGNELSPVPTVNAFAMCIEQVSECIHKSLRTPSLRGID